MDEGLNSEDSSEECFVRFGQYLIEREYVMKEEAPGLLRKWQLDNETVLCRLLQQLIARKLGITEDQPMPQSLVFVADPKAIENSWDKFLSETDVYHKKLRIWENEKTTNPKAKMYALFIVPPVLWNQ